ncbi:MAG: UDP-N-acetylglucosamine acyltransferase [Candidatus Omnitrophota bacterium]|jgi:UDP-N-acetylglucosamine acyltransferase
MIAHSTAIISPKARIDDDVEVGPFCIIGDDAVIGSGTKIESHAVIEGHTTIGKNNILGVGSVIGGLPQTKSYDGEESYVKIGDSNHIREYVTIHRGSHGTRTTKIGDSNYLMAYSHLGHDVQVGNHAVVANGAMMGGHVTIGDNAIVGGLVGVHQFQRIGRFAMVGAMSRISFDVPPFSIVDGNPNALGGVNTTGLKRANFSVDDIRQIRNSFKQLFFSDKLFKDAVAEAKIKQADCVYMKELLDFIKDTKRSVITRRKSSSHAA